MHAELTPEEVALLKRLAAAGEKGRTVNPLILPRGIRRLVNVGYVLEKIVSPDTVVYLITYTGREALEEHQGRK